LEGKDLSSNAYTLTMMLDEVLGGIWGVIIIDDKVPTIGFYAAPVYQEKWWQAGSWGPYGWLYGIWKQRDTRWNDRINQSTITYRLLIFI